MNITDIYQIAEKHFFAKDYRDVKLDNIANALHIKKPSLYHYFQNKRDFYIKTLEYSMKKYINALKDIIKTKKLDKFIIRYIDYPRDKKNLFAIAVQKGYTNDKKIHHILLKGKHIVDQESSLFLKDFHIPAINIYLICQLMDKLARENCIDDYCLDYCVKEITETITTFIHHCMKE